MGAAAVAALPLIPKPPIWVPLTAECVTAEIGQWANVAEFNNVKALMHGEIGTWQGFSLINTNYLEGEDETDEE